ncbi:glycosyl transferase family 1 [Oenococcus oeni IOEB_0607]|uniref:glycosyltransferase family 4 protein n=1 Tax=Oenococcus oeni TaxID=1247 RepID=UPI00050DC195|nr:glycosyltransferase family 4 protein [Oenococcus oeni]KGH79922.1 glycosyl transferase family 1 [Oenococcus oeni IOEB_0607]
MKTIMYLHAGAEMYGSDKVLLQLVTGLDKKQFKPIVVLPEHGPLEKALATNNIQTEVVVYPILRRKYFNLKGIFNYASGYFKAGKVLADLAEKNHVDLVHVNTLAVLEGITLKKRIKKPLIWHVHEILLSPKFMWKLTAYLSAKYADKIVVVSNATGEHLKKAGYAKKNQIITIYNGINILKQLDNSDFRQEFGIPKNAFVFGHVGRINAWKGQEDFLKASLKLMPDYPKMHILFSGNAYKGEEWREGKLKKEINESGFSDRIHYLGFQKNISKIYRTIDVLVSTSNGRETFSLVVAEAMSCSKPVISYNIGGPSELIKDEETGYLVRPGNIDDLFLKMSYIINNTQLVNALGQNGANRISSIFNVKRFIDSFDQLYERINNGRYE